MVPGIYSFPGKAIHANATHKAPMNENQTTATIKSLFIVLPFSRSDCYCYRTIDTIQDSPEYVKGNGR